MSEPISPRTPQQALAALLARYAPKRLLLVGASRLPAVEAFIHNDPQCQLAHSPAAALPAELAGQRFDLALLLIAWNTCRSAPVCSCSRACAT